jgi:hypothetical protein
MCHCVSVDRLIRSSSWSWFCGSVLESTGGMGMGMAFHSILFRIHPVVSYSHLFAFSSPVNIPLFYHYHQSERDTRSGKRSSV